MRLFLAFLAIGLLTGCVSTPQQTPNCDIPAPMEEVAYAVKTPQMPVAASSTSDTATFDLDGLLQLDRVYKSSQTNNTVANENALALEARNAEVNALIECARWQNVWIDIHAEDLKDEKREHQTDIWWYRALIALGLVAANSL